MHAKTELPGGGTRERYFDRPEVPLAASAAVVAAAGVTWNGFLEPIPITRTVGSLIGPAATGPPWAGFGDLVATALQVLIVAGGLALLTRHLGARTGSWTEHAPAIAALTVVPFLVLALYSAVGGVPFVSMVG